MSIQAPCSLQYLKGIQTYGSDPNLIGSDD
jgi:hypothetical protein